MAKQHVALMKPVPDFELASSEGKPWRLQDHRGKNLVIYFYPRDNTPGCTQEGAAFRDSYRAFSKAGADIVGISADSVASHQKFAAKMAFPFQLLSDPEHEACALFDVYKEKSLYGRKFMGIERSTFFLDEQGVLHQQWRKVKVPGHADAVLTAVKQLQEGLTASGSRRA